MGWKREAARWGLRAAAGVVTPSGLYTIVRAISGGKRNRMVDLMIYGPMPTLRRRMLAPIGGPLAGQRMWLDPGEEIQHAIFFQGIYEPHVTAWVLERLRPGGVFVDVGAHVGYYTLMAAARVGPRGAVVAFEPVHSAALHTHVKLNGWHNVTVCAEAVADRTGSLTMGLSPPGNTGMNSAVQPGRFERCIEVPAVRLADRLAGLGVTHVDLLKIDVEGFEFDVLRSGAVLLESADGPDLAFELTPEYLAGAGHSASQLLAWLAACGYRMAAILESGPPDSLTYRLADVFALARETRQVNVVATKGEGP